MISQYKFIVRCFWASILLPSLVLLTKQSISKIMADASKHKKKIVGLLLSAVKSLLSLILLYNACMQLKLKAYFML